MTNKEYIIGLIKNDPEKFFDEDWCDVMCRTMMRKHPGTCEMRADGYPDCAECFKKWLGMEAEG